MSTNKTTNYQLHKWEPGDDFLRSEFNENFAAIDGALVKKACIIVGFYSGNSGQSYSQTIELGLMPLAVLVECRSGIRGNYSALGGLALRGRPVEDDAVKLTDTGFTVCSQNDASTNDSNKTYHYLAIVADK